MRIGLGIAGRSVGMPSVAFRSLSCCPSRRDPIRIVQRRGDMTWASKVRNLVRCIGARLLIEGDWVRLKQMVKMASWPCSEHLRWICRANEKHHLPVPHCLPSGEHRACRMRHGTGRAARVVSKSSAESDRVSLQMHGVRHDACVRLWYQPITRLTSSLRALFASLGGVW